MKKKLTSFVLVLIVFIAFNISLASASFVYSVKVLSKTEVQELKKDELVDYFVDVMIERKACETFHSRSGFSPKGYEKFKELLKVVVYLRQEMLKRGIEPPPVMEWLQ